MAHTIHHTIYKKSGVFACSAEKIKSRINSPKQNAATNNRFLQKLIHPDYVLFDWEYFICELEFE